MNSRFHSFKFLCFLMAAGLVSGQAMAQAATAVADVKAVVIKPITLVKTSDLSFGRLASVAGDVTISAADGSRASLVPASLIAANGASAAPGRASFTVGGEPNLTYAISAPATTVTLANGSNNLSVILTGVYHLNGTATGTAGAASTGMLSSAGADTLGIGGTLTLTDNTPSGTYANTGGISLTVNYN